MKGGKDVNQIKIILGTKVEKIIPNSYIDINLNLSDDETINPSTIIWDVIQIKSVLDKKVVKKKKIIDDYVIITKLLQLMTLISKGTYLREQNKIVKK